MRYALKVTAISLLITMILTLAGLFIREAIKQETAYIKYDNQIHKDFCELAESRWWSKDYLKLNKCL